MESEIILWEFEHFNAKIRIMVNLTKTIYQLGHNTHVCGKKIDWVKIIAHFDVFSSILLMPLTEVLCVLSRSAQHNKT